MTLHMVGIFCVTNWAKFAFTTLGQPNKWSSSTLNPFAMRSKPFTNAKAAPMLEPNTTTLASG